MTDTAPVPSVPTAPMGTMEETEKKNQISIAFLQMVAANAGFEVGTWNADYNGVDVSLRSHVEYPHRWGSEIDLQLKCTSHAGNLHPEFISYSLDRNVYIKLSSHKRFQLGALAVLVVPEDAETWLHQDEDRLFARGCMYFSPATEWEPIEDGAASKTVRCYRSNILTVPALAELLRASSEYLVRS